MQTLHLIVTGRVQDVWFRDFTRSVADDLSIKGWVRNKKDGSVEIMAQGEKLQEFLEKIREGPPRGKVDGVVQEECDEEPFSSFEITH